MLSPHSVVELGQLILEEGRVPGSQRRGGIDDRRVTVFDSTGVGIQDVAIATMALRALRGRRSCSALRGRSPAAKTHFL